MVAPTILASNNAQTTLAGGISNSATSVNLATGTGALFPTLGANQFFKATLISAATPSLKEIVLVTTASGDTMTIVRAQEGTTAQAWLAGDIFASLMTAGMFEGLAQSPLPTDVFVTASETFTVPDGVYYVKTRVKGGGGGGGGSNSSQGGGGGGGGGETIKTWSVTPGDTMAIVIGAGGAGGASGANGGVTGGDTTVTHNATTITAHGGTGGENTGSLGAGGAGGAASGGDQNFQGSYGTDGGTGTDTYGGNGGPGWNGNGAGRGGAAGGEAASSYGAGGGGSYNAPGAGGNGFAGAVEITY